MQVFKTYFKIMNKMKTSILAYFIVFLVIVILMAGQKTSNGTETIFGATKCKIAVFNYDKESEFSSNLVNFLNNNAEIVNINDNKEELQDALFFRKITYIVRIPEGFGNDFLSGKNELKIEKTTASGSTENIYMDFLLDKYINSAKSYINNIPNMTTEKLNEFLNKDMTLTADVQIHSFGKAFDNTTSSYYFLFYAYIIFAVVTLGVGTVMMKFNNIEIKKRNIASPLKLSSYILQLLVANLVFVIGLWVVLCLVSIPIYKDAVLNRNTILLCLNAFVISLVALSISFFISSLVKSRNALNSISNILSLGFSFIGGIFVDQSLLNEKVLSVARFTPTYWYAKTVNEIKSLTVWSNENLTPIICNILIELGFALAILAIALVIIKQKRAIKQI